MRALPGPARSGSSGGSGNLSGSDLIVPLALFPGLPAVLTLPLAYVTFGTAGLVAELAFLAVLTLAFVRFIRTGDRRARALIRRRERAARFWEEESKRRTSPTVHHATPSEPITQARSVPDFILTEDGRIIPADEFARRLADVWARR